MGRGFERWESVYMKRSEMEIIIKRALNTWNGAYYDSTLESFILDMIEEAGMLPPCVGYNNSVQNMICKWEQEEES